MDFWELKIILHNPFLCWSFWRKEIKWFPRRKILRMFIVTNSEKSYFITMDFGIYEWRRRGVYFQTTFLLWRWIPTPFSKGQRCAKLLRMMVFNAELERARLRRGTDSLNCLARLFWNNNSVNNHQNETWPGGGLFHFLPNFHCLMATWTVFRIWRLLPAWF